MNVNEEPQSMDVEVVDVDNEGPTETLELEALEKLTKGFGKGVSERKIVVSRRHSLNDIISA